MYRKMITLQADCHGSRSQGNGIGQHDILEFSRKAGMKLDQYRIRFPGWVDDHRNHIQGCYDNLYCQIDQIPDCQRQMSQDSALSPP